jgi:hypothetical protein
MTTGGEIDGMVFARLSKSNEVPVKGVRVDLMTDAVTGQKLLATARTEESGYYLFKTVKPGKYRIVISDLELNRPRAAPVAPIAVTMPVGGDMLSGKDLYLDPVLSTRDNLWRGGG